MKYFYQGKCWPDGPLDSLLFKISTDLQGALTFESVDSNSKLFLFGIVHYDIEDGSNF